MITLCTTKLLEKKFMFSFKYQKEKMLSLLTKERKAQWSIAVKEFNNESLNLVTIQNKMEKKLFHWWAASTRNRWTIWWPKLNNWKVPKYYEQHCSKPKIIILHSHFPKHNLPQTNLYQNIHFKLLQILMKLHIV